MCVRVCSVNMCSYEWEFTYVDFARPNVRTSLYHNKVKLAKVDLSTRVNNIVFTYWYENIPSRLSTGPTSSKIHIVEC